MDNTTLSVRVSRRASEATDIDVFELVAADTAVPLPRYEAGAHIDVHLPGGLVRQYSLCGPPENGQAYRIAVLRDVHGRGGSRAMHASVQAGDLIRIGRPRNAFALKSTTQPACLLAGGVGITPLIAMAYQLQAVGTAFELHCFARSRDRLAFQAELAGTRLRQHAVLHLDDEPAPAAHSLDHVVDSVAAETAVYACGPAGFLKRIGDLVAQRPAPRPAYHFESFSPPAVASGQSTFTLFFAKSLKTVTVEGNETIVAAAARVGIEIPVSCEQGICGTCLTPVLDGVPDHRDMFLTDDEHRLNQAMTPCCSRALSDALTLDL
ncbi:PDR/VanB family oxidoreductase [Hydrogenophaga sp. OTU3427]|uniref:PDR/VanB family oxidoreductase n=1 Tax=Hydrogenophaga sp. OTU3427 TaxID=3043856 RepID=UPI00313BAFF2